MQHVQLVVLQSARNVSSWFKLQILPGIVPSSKLFPKSSTVSSCKVPSSKGTVPSSRLCERFMYSEMEKKNRGLGMDLG